MKKKLAVLVFGMYREFDIAHKSWKFLENVDYDIFFSTLDKTWEVNEPLGINIFEDVDNQRILNHFPNAKISILSSRVHTHPAHPVPIMAYHWSNLINMVELSPIEYEVILLIRSDLFIGEHGDFSNFINTNKFKDNNICTFNPIKQAEIPDTSWLCVEDTIFIGNSDIMCNTFGGTSLSRFIRLHPEMDAPHYGLAVYLMQNKVYVADTLSKYIQTSITRSLSRYFIDRPVHMHSTLNGFWYATCNNTGAADEIKTHILPEDLEIIYQNIKPKKNKLI